MDRLKFFKDKKVIVSPREDNQILLICIGIALVFWFFVKLSGDYETDRKIEVQYFMPEAKAFVNIPPKEITATLSGTGWDLFYDYLSNSHPSIDFRLSEYPSNMIEPTQLNNQIRKEISDKIKIIDTDEEYIILEFQDEYEKRVPIKFDGEISFFPGYDFKDSITLIPDSVTVYGPVSLVQNLEYWPTSFFQLSDCKADIHEELPLKIAEQGQIILSPTKVILNIEVEEYTQNTVYVPILIKNAADSVRLSINNVKVDFVVGLSRFNDITKDDFVFEVDFKNISLNDADNVISLSPTQIPQRLKALNYIPKSVEFFIVQNAKDSVTLDLESR